MLIEFYGKECGHCLAMHSLIERLEKELGVTVERNETWHDPANEEKRQAASGGICPGVPMFVNTDTGQILCGESSYEELKQWAIGGIIHTMKWRGVVLGTVLVLGMCTQVASAATFGTTTLAGATSGGGQTNTIVATKYTLSGSGVVTNIGIAIGNSAVTSIKVGIYTNNAGAPANLIVSNNTGTLCPANSFCVLSVPPTFLSEGTYWISSLQNQNGSLLYYNGSSQQAAYNNAGGSSYAAGMNSTYPAPTYQNINYIGYASYSTYAKVTVRARAIIRKRTVIR